MVPSIFPLTTYPHAQNELKKHIPAGYEPALTQLQDHSAQYEQLRAEKGKLTALGELPSVSLGCDVRAVRDGQADEGREEQDHGLAPQLKVEEKREVKGLRRTRDQLLSQKGTGAA